MGINVQWIHRTINYACFFYTGVTSDPHFLVETLSGDWLCYTLKGIEGEVYNLLSDIEYYINGLLIGTVFKGSEQTYFGSISVIHQSCETGVVTKFLITADNGLAVIGWVYTHVQ